MFLVRIAFPNFIISRVPPSLSLSLLASFDSFDSSILSPLSFESFVLLSSPATAALSDDFTTSSEPLLGVSTSLSGMVTFYLVSSISF